MIEYLKWYLLMNAINSNQYDKISDDYISDVVLSGFANTAKFPTTKFRAMKPSERL